MKTLNIEIMYLCNPYNHIAMQRTKLKLPYKASMYSQNEYNKSINYDTCSNDV